jgi:hypothetical protein
MVNLWQNLLDTLITVLLKPSPYQLLACRTAIASRRSAPAAILALGLALPPRWHRARTEHESFCGDGFALVMSVFESHRGGVHG